jgi:acyl dehydratase
MSTATLDTRELDSAPSSAPLYARAVIGSVVPGMGGGGTELPAHALQLRDVEVDRGKLAEYDHVCGFTLSEELPATYPHNLAFPLAMSLMCERSFPFPLMGLVHVANSIEQKRPLRASERPTIRVWSENLRPHRRGRQLDLMASAEVDGEVVWTDRSTYLKRGGGGSEEPAANGNGHKPEDEAEWAKTADPSAIWSLDGGLGRRFAEVSGDRNPIHLHALTARLFGFPSAIAHGMWSAAHVLAHYEGHLPESYRFDVSFRAPVRLPSKAAFVERTDEDGTRRFVLLSRNRKVVHLTGTIS